LIHQFSWQLYKRCRATDAADKVSRIFQVPPVQSFTDDSDAARKILRTN